ncbi:MAG: hypothetical protein OEV30_10050 [Ignavibacteria bacterium]|nr:hypothetical protein [Ignavibacteria bacterium]
MEPVALLVAQILALLCVSAACIFLIVVLLRIKEVLNLFEREMKEVTSRALPVLENMEFITNRVRNITETIDDQVSVVQESISSMKEMTENIVELERRVQDRVEGPILDTIGFVAAIIKGCRTFLSRVRA